MARPSTTTGELERQIGDAESPIEYASAATDEAEYAVLEAILARASADDAANARRPPGLTPRLETPPPPTAPRLMTSPKTALQSRRSLAHAAPVGPATSCDFCWRCRPSSALPN